MQQPVEDLKEEIERLKVLVSEQREMLKLDVAQEMLPAVQELVQSETRKALASKTLQISMNPGFLKDYYNKLAIEDRGEYLTALDYAHSEIQKILEIAPNLREKLFKLKGLFEVLQSSSVKNSCSATELEAHHFNELSEAMNLLPKIIIPESKKESQQQSSSAQHGRRSYTDQNYHSPRPKYPKFN